MSFRLPVNTLSVIVKNTVNSLSAEKKIDIVKNEVGLVKALKKMVKRRNSKVKCDRLTLFFNEIHLRA